MRGFTKIMGLLLLVAIGTVASVSATWQYAEYPSNEQIREVNMQVVSFYWDSAETLPEDSVAGENHIALIQRIVDSDEGLNNPASHLNEVISQRVELDKNTASSVAPTKGGNLKNLFDTDEMRELHFNLEFYPQDGQITEYFLYTFERDILANRENVQISPVYKTQITLQNGVWKAVKSWKGLARTIYYDTKQGGGKDMTINPVTWQETVG